MAKDDRSFVPAELRLVLLAACGDWADPQIRSLLERHLHWPSVTLIAQWEQAISVLLARMHALDLTTAVPVRDLEVIERAGAVEDFRMCVLEERLVGLLELLQRNDIQVVLLKGAGISLGAFGHLSARPMGDLDLLVRPDTAARAYELAQTLGWSERGGGLEQRMYTDMQHMLPLTAEDGLGFGLEIHTDLFPSWSPFDFSATDVWRRASPLPGLLPALVPTPEHQLLQAFLHFAWSHCFRRGTWRTIRDVDTLLSDPSIDPRSFASRAYEAKGASCVYWTLALIQKLTGREIPPEMMNGLGMSVSPFMSRLLLRHLATEGLPGSEPPGTRSLRRALWEVAIRPRKSGHDQVRPWTASERWPRVTEIPLAGEEEGGSFTHRLRGLLGYSRQLAGL